MMRNYAALLVLAKERNQNDPLPETPAEMVIWLRAMSDHVAEDISQDQCGEYYELAADMIQKLLDNSTVGDCWP